MTVATSAGSTNVTPPPSFALSPQNVNTVSGELIQVQTQAEADWFNASRDNYLAQLKFTETTDLRDMDRLLLLELLVFRWAQQMAAGQTYDGDLVDHKQMAMDIRSYSEQINKIKTTMGLTKQARDEAANEGSVASYLADLKAKAKVFGVHREKQLSSALALFNEVSTIIGAFDRADEEEKRKIGFETEKDIVDWIRRTALPEYRAIDEHFQMHVQRYWVRDL